MDMMHQSYRIIVRVWSAGMLAGCLALPQGRGAGDSPLHLREDGSHLLRILSPQMLELSLVQTKQPASAQLPWWNFVDAGGQFRVADPEAIAVTVGGSPVTIRSLGFKRRTLYAPLKHRDLRVISSLFLELPFPAGEGMTLNVTSPRGALWPAEWRFVAAMDPLRLSPVIHVNQVGYLPSGPKQAMVGYYLGSLGELEIDPDAGFFVVDAKSGATVYQGVLKPRPDAGFPYRTHQSVFEADFSALETPGEYRLRVPGLGASLPFRIDEGILMNFARAYALGLYHQRCGRSNLLPFTRHTHGPCHLARAEVPASTTEHPFTWTIVAQETGDYAKNPRHTAPRLKDPPSELYPFVNRLPVDVSGGHHDAGDYSKYTINSAAMIHHLVFAVDALPRVAELDNLGLPESGDGLPDLLQVAKWESDFLAKLQDADGGFYFLVYPRNRRYEDDVLPDQGDPQVVWPKNTAATAAAVAALAQCASSPRFRQHYPADAARYLEQAHRGWAFLTNAIVRHGKDGAYQKITHYGDNFMHDDELAWAACELFLATGEQAYHDQLRSWFDPADNATWRWGWWRMAESYGNAVRSYAFAVTSGRLDAGQLDPGYLGRCEDQIVAAAMDTMHWSERSAYGTSFPDETKRVRGGGWYFSTDRAFDLAVGYQLEHPPLNDPRPRFTAAFLGNVNYEAGCNPVNVCYLTGLGWIRQREIVHQYAHNDRRVLPPSGIPLGNIQSGLPYLALYQSELGAMSFPSDDAVVAPYPHYDRWTDTHNVSTEFVVVNQARSLAGLALSAAHTSLRTQAWRSASAQITGLPVKVGINTTVTAALVVPGLDLSEAVVVWEAAGHEPVYGTNATFVGRTHGPQWVEVEALWPDGRRVFGVTNFFATNGLPIVTVTAPDARAAEARGDPGQYQFTRDGDLSRPLTIQFTFTGTATKWTDFRRPEGDMPESITFPVGAATATLTIVPVDDPWVEGAETAVLTLVPGAGYNTGEPASAAVEIADNDPGILDLKKKDSGVELTWSSTPGSVYRILAKDSLTTPGWTTVSGDIQATEVITVWLDTSALAVGMRFYHVIEAP
jgi:hypothetical protein